MIKMKTILSEAYAWERQDGKPLPTLKDVQEAYDAKGVDEAEDKADKDYDGDGEIESGSEEYLGSRDKAIKSAMKEEEDVCESCGKPTDECECEEHDHSEDSDESALNMRSLGESFWGRVKGNLHGHEYILREAFKK